MTFAQPFDLIDYIRAYHDITLIGNVTLGHSEGRAMNDFFNNLAMPVPAANEYFETSEKKFQHARLLVVLEDIACVMAIVPRNLYHNFRHPNILHPFGSRLIGHMLRADFYPGVKTPTGKGPINAVRTLLRQDGIDYYDAKPRNTGLLPDEHPLAIDHGAVRILSPKVAAVERSLEPQLKFFQPLYDAFEAAWPQNQEKPNPEKLADLWKLAAQMKKDGILVPGWNNHLTDEYQDHRFIGPVRRAGKNYARKWSPNL